MSDLGLALQVGLAECFYGVHIQRVGGQVIGHVVRQVDQPDQRSLEAPNPEVLHHPAVPRLVHVHPHKQNLRETRVIVLTCVFVQRCCGKRLVGFLPSTCRIRRHR